MVFQNNVLSGASGSGTTTHTIDQSIRFNSADSAYMHRTPSSSGNRKTFTSSCWVKLGDLTDCALPMPTVSQTASYGVYLSGNDIQIFIYYTGSAWQGQLYTNRKFRDPSAWFHFVLVVDTTQAASTERVRFYINGTRETDWQLQNYPNQNQDTDWNNSGEKMGIGVNANGFGGSFGEYYAAEMVYIDGTAYGPENFGEYNSSGIWVPKDVSGLSFGTNGFHIDGRDASDLGDDESGNGNDFTVVNLAAHDQMVGESPTNNFCTINAVYADVTGANDVTLTEGNLKAAGTSSAFDIKGMTFNVPKSGKWYMEYTIGGGYDGFGFCVVGQEGTITPGGNGLGQLSVAQGGGIQYNGWRNGASVTVNMGTFTSGHIHQVAIDVDNGKFYYGIQNTYYAADAGTDGNPSAGTNHTSTFDFAGNDVVLMTAVTTDSNPEHWNFGQNGTFNGTVTAQGNSDGGGVGNFYYAVPTGYKALCTKNLGAD